MAKERPEGSGYHPFPLWEKEVKSFLKEARVFTGMISVVAVGALLGIIGTQALKEAAKQTVGKFKKPATDHPPISGDYEGVMKVFSPKEEEKRRKLVKQTGLSTQQNRRPPGNW